MNKATGLRACDSPPLLWAPWLASAILLAWLGLMLLLDTGLYGDNIEQVVWAHSLEWGYHKHPPLPTWLLGAVQFALGRAWWWTDVLASACLLATLWLSWSIARTLAGPTVAAVSVLLWGLLQCFSSRAQLYNHNTVLVLCMALAVWCALRASAGRWRWWLGVGVAAGLGMLAKYQAAVPLSALLLTLALSGRLRERRQALGAATALGVALLVFAPHLAWVIEHDFSTLRYASQSVESAGFVRRLQFIASFLVNQLRMVLPALVALGVCLLLARMQRSRASAPAAAEPADPRLPLWLGGLFWGLLLFLLALPLIGGINLRNHWGVQTFQFFAVWLAWRWCRRGAVQLRQLAIVALLLHAVSMVVYGLDVRNPQAMAAARRVDNAFPGERMAQAAQASWTAVTRCPLRYVAGDFEAGLISAYHPQHPVVYVGAMASPWVDPAQLQSHGVLYAVPQRTELPPGVQVLQDIDLAPPGQNLAGARRLVLAVQAPSRPCP